MAVYELIDGGRIIADAEFVAARHPDAVLVEEGYSAKDDILRQLAEIDEQTSKPRILRELRLNKAATKAWLQAQDDKAELLRAELAAL